jgi:hypothetical protein
MAAPTGPFSEYAPTAAGAAEIIAAIPPFLMALAHDSLSVMAKLPQNDFLTVSVLILAFLTFALSGVPLPMEAECGLLKGASLDPS